MKLFFLIAAIVCFLLATVVALGWASMAIGAALIPLGLTLFACSFLPLPS